MNIGIIGGGLSGISLQYYLKHNSEILEKQDSIGGLCKTYSKDGFYYDIGGHAIFSKNQNIMNEIDSILKDNVHYCKRINQILFKDKYIKYPFENGLSSLDKEDAYNCIIDFLKNDRKLFSNFEEWIYYTFGNTISNSYLIPYNKKIWKTPLKNMGTEWVDRIPKPPLEDILKSAIGIETEGYIHQLNFKYPITGGIQALIHAYCKPNCKIKTNIHIQNIRYKNNIWTIDDGTNKFEFDELVITAPITEIIPLLDNVPENILNSIKQLKHNSIKVIMIGVNNESLMNKSCIFIPDENILAHRVCFMGYFSKNNVPKGKSSLIAEITTQINSNIYKASNDVLIEKTINDLHSKNIINKNEIITTDIKTHEYGYIIPDKSYSYHMNKIKAYTSYLGIHLLGRFAEHDYINMDQVIDRSKTLAEKLNLKI